MPMGYKVRKATLPLLPKGAKPIAVLHFSDLHLTPNKKREIKQIKSFINLAPDMVISTGDFLAHPDAVGLGPWASMAGHFGVWQGAEPRRGCRDGGDGPGLRKSDGEPHHAGT